MMNTNDIDLAIAHWRDKLRLVDDNLRSFVALPAYQRLAGAAGQPQPGLLGQSQARVSAAMAALGQLHQQKATLGQTLDRAAALRASLSRILPNQRSLQEIEQLLTGPSIQAAVAPTPPERRELLREVEKPIWLSPDQVMELMLTTFRFVRDGVLAVAAAADRVSVMMARQQAELARLRGLAGPSSAGTSAQLEQAQSALEDLAALAAYDPISAEEHGRTIAQMLENVSQSLQREAGLRQGTDASIREAAALLDRIRDAHQRGAKANSERLLKVQPAEGSAVPAPPDPEELAALESWLARLRQTIEKKDLGPAEVGLRKWRESANDLLGREEHALRASEALLRRSDARGLFDALLAKATKLGRTHEPSLAALGEQVRQLLAKRPTPLAILQQRIAEYEERLL